MKNKRTIKVVDNGNYDYLGGYIFDENSIKNENDFNDMESWFLRWLNKTDDDN
ncbi:MAG: hypothetical protein IPL95_16765 [Saprospiraceae bacterium]|nr:hypothetical protein [Saprospiraceae bacterium]